MTSSIAKRAALAAAILGAATVSLAACAPEPAVQCDFTTTPWSQGGEPAMVAEISGSMEPMALNTVSVIDGGIRRKVLVQSVRAGRSQTGNMQVQTRLMNCTDHPLQVDARTNFMTAEGGEAEAPSMWQRVALPPRSFATYAESGISGAGAESFLIEVKEAR